MVTFLKKENWVTCAQCLDKENWKITYQGQTWMNNLIRLFESKIIWYLYCIYQFSIWWREYCQRTRVSFGLLGTVIIVAIILWWSKISKKIDKVICPIKKARQWCYMPDKIICPQCCKSQILEDPTITLHYRENVGPRNKRG